MGSRKTDLTKDGDFLNNTLPSLKEFNRVFNLRYAYTPWNKIHPEFDDSKESHYCIWYGKIDFQREYEHTCECCGRPIHNSPWDSLGYLCLSCCDEVLYGDEMRITPWGRDKSMISDIDVMRFFLDNDNAITKKPNSKRLQELVMHIDDNVQSNSVIALTDETI